LLGHQNLSALRFRLEHWFRRSMNLHRKLRQRTAS